jgi:hypothetical protein
MPRPTGPGSLRVPQHAQKERRASPVPPLPAGWGIGYSMGILEPGARLGYGPILECLTPATPTTGLIHLTA